MVLLAALSTMVLLAARTTVRSLIPTMVLLTAKNPVSGFQLRLETYSYWSLGMSYGPRCLSYPGCHLAAISQKNFSRLTQRRVGLGSKKQPASENDESHMSTSIMSTVVTSDPVRSGWFSVVMALSGAVLGPFLDSYHSLFGVLQYDAPVMAQLWSLNADYPALVTTWWVPELFGLAAFIIGWLYVLFDASAVHNHNQPVVVANNRSGDLRLHPSATKILTGIALFSFQYWLSGLLYRSGVHRLVILNVLSILSALGFLALDSTWTGFLVSSATATSGPLIEVVLLSLSRRPMLVDWPLYGAGYHYADTGETGYFPLWIIPVYFLGGSAVGNLARGVWQVLDNDPKPRTGKVMSEGGQACPVCQDSRRVPCPNCDGIGTYIAMGKRRITCTSCQGHGLVICRECFARYDEDPNDLEAIRNIVRTSNNTSN